MELFIASFCPHYPKNRTIFEQFIPVLQSAWAPALKYTSKLIQPITSLEKGMGMCLISFVELICTVTASYWISILHIDIWVILCESKWIKYQCIFYYSEAFTVCKTWKTSDTLILYSWVRCIKQLPRTYKFNMTPIIDG